MAEFDIDLAGDVHVRARIERTASGKLVQMLTADEKATEQEVKDCVDRVVAGFVYFDNRVKEEVEGGQ